MSKNADWKRVLNATFYLLMAISLTNGLAMWSLHQIALMPIKASVITNLSIFVLSLVFVWGLNNGPQTIFKIEQDEEQ